MSFSLLQVDQRVAKITLNDPEKRNALGPDMVKSLTEHFDQAFKDDNVRVILLQANGPAFCAGADLGFLKQLQSNSYAENLEDSRKLKALFQLIYTGPKPVIGIIKGPAVAGGCGLAALCDLTYAIPQAVFGYTEVKIGFIPALVMVYLARKIGEGRSKEWLMTGKLFSADKALHDGLITGIYDTEIIEEKVMELALELANQTSGQSQKLIKEMFSAIHHLPLEEALEYAASMNAEARGSDDCKKGIGAFLQKEKITW